MVQILVTGYGPLEEADRGSTGVVIGRQRAIGLWIAYCKPDLVTVNDLDNGVTVLLNTYIPGSGGSACATVPPFSN